MSEIKVYSVERATAALPATTQAPIFTVSDYVRVHCIMGVVSGTAIQNQANATKLIANPTTGADVDLCVALDIDNDAIGTVYTITGDFSDAMIGTTSGAVETTDYEVPFIVAPGTIDLDCAATNTGEIAWTIIYSPVNASAYVVAA